MTTSGDMTILYIELIFTVIFYVYFAYRLMVIANKNGTENAWMAIAEKRGKPSWWGILTIVPVANLIVPGYLAFSD